MFLAVSLRLVFGLRWLRLESRGDLMEWLNIKTSDLHAPEFIGSDPKQRATWLSVICYCVEQENYGKIENSREWKCRRWQQTCGVTLKEVWNAPMLLTWNQNDLHVWKYPTDKQKLVQEKRVTAQINGQKGGRPRNEPETNIETNVGLQTKPRLEPISESGREGKGSGIEGNGKELPPNPQRGNGAKAKESRLPTSDAAKRLSLLFHRRLTTEWDEKEIKAFKKSAPFDLQELELVCRYTESERKRGESGMHRRDLVTLLNNVKTEQDRAREWAIRNPKTAKAHGLNGNGQHKPAEAEPSDFRGWLAVAYPKAPQTMPWGEIPHDIRTKYIDYKNEPVKI